MCCMRHLGAMVAGSFVSCSAANVFVEVDFAGATPDAFTDGSLAISSIETLSVYLWADQPGVLISGFALDLDGQSERGVTGAGGEFVFAGLGAVDPGGLFLIDSPGAIDGLSIGGIFGLNVPSPFVELPTSASEAIEIYSGFTGSAETVGAGVMPVLSLTWGAGVQPKPIRSFGVFQTPAPGSVALLGVLGLVASRRGR